MRRRPIQLWLLLPVLVVVSLAGMFVSAYKQRNRDDALMRAIGYGQTENALRLVREGANPNQRESLGSRPTILQELLDRFLRRKRTEAPQGLTALLLAAKKNERAVVAELLERGAKDLEAVDKDNATVLLIEAQNSHWDILQLLLKRGADPNGCKAAFDTPLRSAVGNDAPLKTIRTLLDAGANPKKDYGISSLTIAARDHRLELMRLLIRGGADLHAFGGAFGSGSPLIAAVAAEPGPTDMGRLKRIKAVRLLLHSGANVKRNGYRDETAFGTAAEMGDYQMMDLLLKAGATSNVGIMYGSPLMIASYSGNLRMMRFLIARGADVNMTRFKWGETALDDAASGGQLEAVKLLLLHGAMVESEGTEEHGSNPIGRAKKEGHKAIAELLHKAFRRQESRPGQRHTFPTGGTKREYQRLGEPEYE